MINLGIGLIILLLGFPIGNYLARITKEELKVGQKWFKLIVFVSILCSVVSLMILNDVLLFAFLFMAIVTSRSLIK